MPNFQRQNRCIVSGQNKCQHETHSCNQSVEKVDAVNQDRNRSDDDGDYLPNDVYHIKLEPDDDDSMF